MRKFELLGLTTNIDVDKIGLQLLKLHEQDESKLHILSFGMLDAEIMDQAEQTIYQAITKNIDPLDLDMFKPKFKAFMNEVMKEITLVIYNNAKMIC